MGASTYHRGREHSAFLRIQSQGFDDQRYALFYQLRAIMLIMYVSINSGSIGEQDAAIAFCYKTLNGLGMTGRLRVAREVR